MRKILYPTLLTGALLVGGCATQPSPHPIPRTVRAMSGSESEYFTITEKDREMRRAVLMARRHVRVFITALKNPAPGQADFEVKKPFVQGPNVEHIWLAKVTYSGGRFHGYVDNHPQVIKGLKLGQRVSVNPNEITDWLFIDHGNLVGGYTIRVLYRSLPPDRQKAFTDQADFKIQPQ